VLATKVHLPLGGKQKEVKGKESRPEPKKRKQSSGSVKGRVVAKKNVKAAVSGRKATRSSRRSQRGSPSLPKVSEDEEATHKEVQRLVQTDIDSRCYDLTVSPLADVTSAYENPESEIFLGNDIKFRSVKVGTILHLS
jgi:hypothetical protein